MYIVDKIEIIISTVALIVSAIGLIHSKKANKLSNDANNIAEIANSTAKEALNDSQKDYMPLIKFVDKIKCEDKDVEELCSEVTFDLYNGIECNENAEIGLDEEDEYLPISLTIKNIGKGIIRKMVVKSFLLCAENKESFVKKLEKEYETEIIFFESDHKCEQEFILCENEKVDINILLPESECRFDIGEMSGIVAENDILVIMELEIFSTNKSSYCQKALWCNFENGIAKRSSFDEAVLSSCEKLKNKK